jgi:hypothetical protein
MLGAKGTFIGMLALTEIGEAFPIGPGNYGWLPRAHSNPSSRKQISVIRVTSFTRDKEQHN